MKTPRVAFVGWNPFQFLHFSSVFPHFPEATLIVEKRRSRWQTSCFENHVADPSRIVHCDRRAMRDLDGKYDVLVCQTPFHGIDGIRESRIAMLQYGYAKEAHNYGAWRSFADVSMTFGPHASARMAPFCATVATGNPRYEDWSSEPFREAARAKLADRLDPEKKTVLYAPTWGELSSYSSFADAVLALADEFNVILKVHHITERGGEKPMEPVRGKFGVIHGALDDIVELLTQADVLISDYSGAIFDAVYCQVPIVLVTDPALRFPPDCTCDPFSMERARRGELGESVSTAGDLRAAVRRATNTSFTPPAALRDELFVDASGAAGRVAEVIHQAAAGVFSPTPEQARLRDEWRAHPKYRSRPSIVDSVKSLFRRQPPPR